jgi:hypothetical protein
MSQKASRQASQASSPTSGGGKAAMGTGSVISLDSDFRLEGANGRLGSLDLVTETLGIRVTAVDVSNNGVTGLLAVGLPIRLNRFKNVIKRSGVRRVGGRKGTSQSWPCLLLESWPCRS